MDDLPLAMHDVCFGYGREPVLRGLDLEAPAGAVVGLIGPNGCGKTTTLHLACGLLAPASGAISVLGHLLPGRPEMVNALFAYVPDTPSGFEHLRPPEYYRLVGAVHGADADYVRRTEELTAILGLGPYRALSLGSLSYGSRRKVAIAAAAALDRPLLFLDEATNGLDPESVLVLERLVRGLAARGDTVIVATQDVYFAERVCDAVALLVDGRVAVSGSVAGVKRDHGRDSLRDVFLAVTGIEVSEEAIDAALARPDHR